MDPQACWRRILEAVEDNDQAEVDGALRDLWDWFVRGGFAPTASPELAKPVVASHGMLEVVIDGDHLVLRGYNAMMEPTDSYPFLTDT